MANLGGTCDPRFQRVRDLLDANIDAGREVGASLYLDIDGKTAIDLWGGWTDKEHTAPWSQHTIVNVFSGTKPVTSLAVLMLVDRGQIDLEAPVAQYWPAFAQNGKAGVKVRHILGHTSGVSGWEAPFTYQEAIDTERSTARLAGQAPWWEPGTLGSYHASSFGHLTSELVRRVTGRPLSAFIRDEIASPLHADFALGVGDADLARVATVYPSEEERRPAPVTATTAMSQGDFISAKTRAGSFAGTMGNPLEVFNSTQWRRTEFGGSSGHANANGLGRIVSALSLGGVSHGVRLLSPATIALIFNEQSNGVDHYYRKPIRWGIGYALASEDSNRNGPLPFIRPGRRTAFWYGTGGSMAIADLENRVTVGYAMNQCQSGRNSLNGVYYKAIYECL